MCVFAALDSDTRVAADSPSSLLLLGFPCAKPPENLFNSCSACCGHVDAIHPLHQLAIRCVVATSWPWNVVATRLAAALCLCILTYFFVVRADSLRLHAHY